MKHPNSTESRILSATDLESLQKQALDAVAEVGLLGGLAYNQEPKFLAGDITHPYDKAAHHRLVQRLKVTGLPVLSEEDLKAYRLAQIPEGQFWLIDPIDGTYNLWRGLDFVATSVALMDGVSPILGVIKNLNTGDIFQGGIGIGPSRNNVSLSVSSTSNLSRAVLATGFPVGSDRSKFIDGLAATRLEHIGKVRMFGSAALSLCLLAEGKVDAYWEQGIFLWDVAAGIAVAKAAGANISMTPHRKSFRLDVLVNTPELAMFLE